MKSDMKKIVKKKSNVKKAIVDQVLLGIFLFFILIAFGATVSDNSSARDTYYNLKKITDNAVLTTSKYYSTVYQDTQESENVYLEMMKKTKLGKEVLNKIEFEWNFEDNPNYVVAKIVDYRIDTFWLKLLGLEFFDVNAESRANLVVEDSDKPTAEFSYGLAPFAVNEQDFVIGEEIDFHYELASSWNYDDKDTFYPIVDNCSCECAIMLGASFSGALSNLNLDVCGNLGLGCLINGQASFAHYAKNIDDFYNANYEIDFEVGLFDTPMCLLGNYLGNIVSTWNTQINHLENGIYELIGKKEEKLPLEMDLITLGSDAKASGIVRVRLDGVNITGNSIFSQRQITLKTTIIPAKKRNGRLVY